MGVEYCTGISQVLLGVGVQSVYLGRSVQFFSTVTVGDAIRTVLYTMYVGDCSIL